MTKSLSIPTTTPNRLTKKPSRFKKQLFAKTTFYVSAALFAVFVVVSFIMFDSDRELEKIPETRTADEVLAPLMSYLAATNVASVDDVAVTVNCATEFEGAEFTADYLEYGSWRINAYYKLVRYYWRVDDLTLEVKRDNWNRTTNPTFNC
jgi:hypothetical protein